MGKRDDETTHQIHIEVSKELHDSLKKILPEWGGISSLIRSFLIHFVNKWKKYEDEEESSSPFDKAVDEVVKKTKMKRSLDDE